MHERKKGKRNKIIDNEDFSKYLKNWESTVNENQKRIEIFESFLKLCNSILNTIQLLF